MSSPSSKEVLAILKRHRGFREVSQRGNHVKLTDGVHTVIIAHPRHDLPIGTLTSVLRQAGMTRAEFDALL